MHPALISHHRMAHILRSSVIDVVQRATTHFELMLGETNQTLGLLIVDRSIVPWV